MPLSLNLMVRTKTCPKVRSNNHSTVVSKGIQLYVKTQLYTFSSAFVFINSALENGTLGIFAFFNLTKQFPGRKTTNANRRLEL